MFCVFFLGCPIAISILNRSDAAPVVCLSQTQTRYFGRDYVPWLALALALHWHTCLLNLFAGGDFVLGLLFFRQDLKPCHRHRMFWWRQLRRFSETPSARRWGAGIRCPRRFPQNESTNKYWLPYHTRNRKLATFDLALWLLRLGCLKSGLQCVCVVNS